MVADLTDIYFAENMIRKWGQEVDYLILTPDTIAHLTETSPEVNQNALRSGRQGRVQAYDVKQGTKDVIVTNVGWRLPIEDPASEVAEERRNNPNKPDNAGQGGPNNG